MPIRLSPFIHSGNSTQSLMWNLCLVLVMVLAAQIWLMGWSVLQNHFTIIITALICEYWFVKLRAKNPFLAIKDGSAIVASMILAMGLPADMPMIALISGGVIVMSAKHLYGGLGMNLFNPAMVAYAFILVAFPEAMSKWPSFLTNSIHQTDAISHATPLATKLLLPAELSLLLVYQAVIVCGGIFLLFWGIISWHMPVFFILTFSATVTGNALIMGQTVSNDLLFHFVSGAMLFGAFFVITDPVESPQTKIGKIIYASLIGFILAMIRLFGSYAEGLAFAVLLGNMTSPLIDVCIRNIRKHS